VTLVVVALVGFLVHRDSPVHNSKVDYGGDSDGDNGHDGADSADGDDK
jgi:hypothetical protein